MLRVFAADEWSCVRVGRLSCTIIILSEGTNHILVLISYEWREERKQQPRRNGYKICKEQIQNEKAPTTSVFNMNIYLKIHSSIQK